MTEVSDRMRFPENAPGSAWEAAHALAPRPPAPRIAPTRFLLVLAGHPKDAQGGGLPDLALVLGPVLSERSLLPLFGCTS